MESGRSHGCEKAAQNVGLTHLMIQEMGLSCATCFNGPSNRGVNLRQDAGVSRVEADKDLVRCILQPSVRFVQLTGSLARQLAELVAIGDVRKCTKNQIRTHKVNLLPNLSAGTAWHRRYSHRLDISSRCCPKQPVLPFRRTNWASSSKNFCRKAVSSGNRQLAL